MPDPVPQREHLRRSLLRWAWCGALCALPSFCWAIAMTDRHPTQLPAMLLGVVTYVLAFAWFTARPSYREGVERSDFGWALRVAANTRAALAPVMLLGPDMLLGAISMGLVQWSPPKSNSPAWALGSPFLLTFVTTLVQGALVSATMFLLALVLWPMKRRWRVWREGKTIARPSVPREVGDDVPVRNQN